MDAWKDADLPINGEEVGTAELFWLGTSGMKFRESIIKLMICKPSVGSTAML
jgi:hypothetical protein